MSWAKKCLDLAFDKLDVGLVALQLLEFINFRISQR